MYKFWMILAAIGFSVCLGLKLGFSSNISLAQLEQTKIEKRAAEIVFEQKAAKIAWEILDKEEEEDGK